MAATHSLNPIVEKCMFGQPECEEIKSALKPAAVKDISALCDPKQVKLISLNQIVGNQCLDNPS